jgi:hypothetical protein
VGEARGWSDEVESVAEAVAAAGLAEESTCSLVVSSQSFSSPALPFLSFWCFHLVLASYRPNTCTRFCTGLLDCGITVYMVIKLEETQGMYERSKET